MSVINTLESFVIPWFCTKERNRLWASVDCGTALKCYGTHPQTYIGYRSTMDKQGQKKADQLGMPHGTAQGRLRKNVMFSLIKLCGVDVCFQCGESIDSPDDLSIEHKVPWLDSESPVELFFDLTNIAFSHLKCNAGAARRTQLRDPCPSFASYKHHGCRCEGCINAYRVYQREDARKRRSTPKESCRIV